MRYSRKADECPDDLPLACPHCGSARFELWFGGTRPARVICTNCGDDVDALPERIPWQALEATEGLMP